MDLKNFDTLRTDSVQLLLMMEIYITCLLQILSFFSCFRRFEMKNFLRRPTMVAEPPQNFFHFYGPVFWTRATVRWDTWNGIILSDENTRHGFRSISRLTTNCANASNFLIVGSSKGTKSTPTGPCLNLNIPYLLCLLLASYT